jgi:signal peptidase I
MDMQTVKRFIASAWETVEVIFIAAVTVFLIRSFLVQPFLVSGASMEPNFSAGDYLLVDEISYRFRAPERGEVVVFKYPLDKGTFFIKRIIGTPGETVAYEKGDIRITNGEGTFLIDERYLLEGTTIGFFPKVTLGESEYFVLGDNRFQSFDSRNWGSVERSEIVGIARVRIFPFVSFGLIESPLYQ